MKKIKIEELIVSGQEEYIELYLKENKTEEENKRLSLLKKQINLAKEMWSIWNYFMTLMTYRS